MKRSRFGEGSFQFVMLSPERGKIRFAAFGAGKEKSRRRSSLQTGNLVSVVLYRKNSESSFSLKEIHPENEYENIRLELGKQAYYFLILEILDIMLLGEQAFDSFDFLLETLERIDSQSRFEKYVFYFIFRAFQSEGIFPAYDDEFPQMVTRFGAPDFNLGNGSHRFLKDIEQARDCSFWDKREISRSVIGNLLDLISLSVRYHYDRELKSLSLIS